MTNASAAPRAAAATADDIEAAPTLDSLPPEVLGVALAFLRPSSMMPLTECSRQWRDTDFDNVYWKPVFLQDFSRPTREVEETLDGDSDESHETSSTESSSSGSDSDESDSDASSSEGSDSDESEESSNDASSASDSDDSEEESSSSGEEEAKAPPPAADPFDMFAAPSSAPATTSNDDILKMF